MNTLSVAPAAFASVKDAEKAPRLSVIAAYAVFLTVGFTVYHFIAEGEFSALLTLSVMLQCLAVALLALQCHSSGSVAGVSSRALALEGLALVCRLSSTLWLNGYLPVDASGDHIFQLTDICTLGIVAYLMHHVLVVKRHTYQADEDTFPVTPFVLGCFILGAVLHGDMNDRPLFDSLWMAGLFLGIVAVLPQLWLVTRNTGRVEALTSHYIAAMALGRVLSGIFMWHARYDLTCQPWVGNFNHAVWAILGAHLLHLLLLGDFAYYYVKALLQRGLDSLDYVDCGCFV